MATQLIMVNNVLARLREDPVASVSSDAYSQLIAMWINDGMRELSDRFAWTALEHEIEVSLIQGTAEYALSATTDESLLIWDQRNRPVAYLYDDVSDGTMNGQMLLITEETRIRLESVNRAQQNLNPVHFSLKLATDGSGYLFTVWPAPQAARLVRIRFWTPQPDLAIDGTDNTTNNILNNPTIEAYVHLAAANERGEEMGEPGNILERRYNNLLGGIIEAAMMNDERANVYESHRD